jgi:hypothetical protein
MIELAEDCKNEWHEIKRGLKLTRRWRLGGSQFKASLNK